MADKDSIGEKEPDSPGPSPIPVITEEEKDSAAIARSNFEVGNYGACLEKLHALAKLRGNDIKINHNLIVVKFHQSGSTRIDEMRKNLGHVCTQAKINLSNIDSWEDTDHAILYFNHAVILYHMRQHHEAIRILEKLFQMIEPLEESLCHKILLLLVETYLCIYQSDKALTVVTYLEKLLFSSESNKGTQEPAVKDNKDATSSEETELEKYRPRLHILKTRCFLQMKHVKVCKREIKTLMNFAGPCVVTLFLKSNFEYIRQNYRKAIKLLNSAQPSSDFVQTGQCIPVMYFNNLACVHFYMGKYQLAAYYGRRALQENANAIAELPKRKGQSLNNRHIKTLSMNRRYELLYNTGIQLLHAGRPLGAFECLTEAVQMYPTNPRLWLRLAECCVATKSTHVGDGNKVDMSRQRSIVRNVIGTGLHRKVILSPGSCDYKCSDGQSAAFPAATLEFASLCLSNALYLLPDETTIGAVSTGRSASSSSVRNESSEVSDAMGKHPGPVNHTAPPYHALKPADIAYLRSSILACSAYVSLSLGDNVTALEYSNVLLSQTKLPGSLRYLGHLYAAEALINMDLIVEAIQHLAPNSLTDVSVMLPVEQGEKPDSGPADNQDGGETHVTVSQHYPASIEVARATMLLNLACAHALRSEWDKARNCLKQTCNMLPENEIPQQALFLGIYIELQTGDHQLALKMVKKQQLIPYMKSTDSLAVGKLDSVLSSQTSYGTKNTGGKAGRSKDPWQK